MQMHRRNITIKTAVTPLLLVSYRCLLLQPGVKQSCPLNVGVSGTKTTSSPAPPWKKIYSNRKVITQETHLGKYKQINKSHKRTFCTFWDELMNYNFALATVCSCSKHLQVLHVC